MSAAPRILALAFALGALGIVASARAADPEPGAETPEQRQARAFATFQSGERQFKGGQYDAAAGLFQQAFETWKDPAYLFNVGLAFEKAERWRLALEWYDRFLAEYPKVPNVSEVRRRRDAASKSREASRAEVMVVTTPSGARASLPSDPSVAACATPCLLRVDPGPVTVKAVLGRRTKDAARSLAPNERWDLSLDLPEIVDVHAPPPEPDRTGAWVAWGVGGAALITGTVFGVMANGDYDDGTALAGKNGGVLGRADYDRLTGLRHDLERDSLVADIGFVGAIVGAAVGTILWVTAEPAPAADPPHGATGGPSAWHF